MDGPELDIFDEWDDDYDLLHRAIIQTAEDWKRTGADPCAIVMLSGLRQ